MLGIQIQACLGHELFLTRQGVTLWTQPLIVCACLCTHKHVGAHPFTRVFLLTSLLAFGSVWRF